MAYLETEISLKRKKKSGINVKKWLKDNESSVIIISSKKCEDCQKWWSFSYAGRFDRMVLAALFFISAERRNNYGEDICSFDQRQTGSE